MLGEDLTVGSEQVVSLHSLASGASSYEQSVVTSRYQRKEKLSGEIENEESFTMRAEGERGEKK